jgi:Squalene/phytoene synthase
MMGRSITTSFASSSSRRSGRPRMLFATTATSNSTSEHQPDISNVGRVLEGGKVIDFGAVKGTEKAETALQRAKSQYLAGLSSNRNGGGQQHHQQQHDSHAATKNGLIQHTAAGESSSSSTTTTTTTTSNRPMILGINDDVIAEVGHELGTFADADAVQACAAYLRSQAPAGMFQPLVEVEEPSSSILSSSSSEAAATNSNLKARQLLHKAYVESGEVTSAFAKTFYMGTMLLGDEARQSIWAIYVWCRRTDEIVDAPRDNNNADLLLQDLSEWEVRLENLFASGSVVDVYDLCLLDVRIRYPTLSIQPFQDMIRGMLMDVPGLGQDRYETFDELHLYCYRVAGTVGVMSLPIFGCAEGFDDITARYVLFW